MNERLKNVNVKCQKKRYENVEVFKTNVKFLFLNKFLPKNIILKSVLVFKIKERIKKFLNAKVPSPGYR